MAPSVTAVGTSALSSAAGLQVLTTPQAELLTRLLNRLIPKEDRMPAAGDMNVTLFIDALLAEAPHLRRAILGFLTALPSEIPESALDAEVDRLESLAPREFHVLLQTAYTGYYGHPEVLSRLGMRSDRVSDEAFDAQLLDAVRARGPICRNL
jgi:hypothetical protein